LFLEGEAGWFTVPQTVEKRNGSGKYQKKTVKKIKIKQHNQTVLYED